MQIQKKETDPEKVLYPSEDEVKFFEKVRNSPASSPLSHLIS